MDIQAAQRAARTRCVGFDSFSSFFFFFGFVGYKRHTATQHHSILIEIGNVLRRRLGKIIIIIIVDIRRSDISIGMPSQLASHRESNATMMKCSVVVPAMHVLASEACTRHFQVA